jgi:hypothetical protein
MPVLQKPTKTGVVIRCYVNPNVENMGLEQYGISIFDGAIQVEPLGFIEKNGVRRYLTGLNEDAPEVLALQETERQAVRKDIRETAAKVYKMLTGGDEIDPSFKNKEFWKQCSLLAPTNDAFWGKDIAYPEGFTLALDSSGKFLDLENPMDILVERAIRAGGYRCLVSPSLEEALSLPIPPKFYLDRLEKTAMTNTEVRKLTNKAKAELDNLRDINVDKLLLVARCFDPDCTQYKASTPADIVYYNLDRGIDGELWEKNKRQAAQVFLDLTRLNLEDLTIRSIINIAKVYRFIDQKNDGYVYFMQDGNVLGRNLEEAFVFLKNPIHQDILNRLQEKVDFEMNR